MLNCFQRVCISEDLLFILPICSTCMQMHDRVEWHSKHCLCKSHDRGKEKKSKEYVAGVAVVAPSEDNASQRGVTQ